MTRTIYWSYTKSMPVDRIEQIIATHEYRAMEQWYRDQTSGGMDCFVAAKTRQAQTNINEHQPVEYRIMVMVCSDEDRSLMFDFVRDFDELYSREKTPL